MAGKILLTCMGEIYQLTKSGYRRYLEAVAKSGSADLNKFGKPMGKVHDVTDITSGNARTILEGGCCSWLPFLDK